MARSNGPRARQVLSWLMIAIITLIIVAMLFSILDQPGGGPVTEATGVIQSSRSIHPPAVIATVRLENNNFVQASVAFDSAVQAGKIAHIHVFHSVITGRRSYEIYRMDKSQQ